VLGIVIGIASVIAMISIGEGSKSSIEASIQSIGSNLVIVTPGFARGSTVVRFGQGSGNLADSGGRGRDSSANHRRQSGGA